MKYKPHNYQAFASEFILEHPVCCLMLDMGLGKTVITLTALWELVLDRFDVSRILVIAPKRVAEDTWPKEIAKWEHLSGLSFSLVLGSRADREYADIDFFKLNTSIRKIVFVLTINEALERHLNFSMVKDAYIRLLDPDSGQEIYSFMLTDYYDNVTSMMLGEIYLHNTEWKFNAIGNGVARDLAGLCQLYGVETN